MSEQQTEKKRAVSRDEWEWFGFPGHFICARDCNFRLCTKVGDFLGEIDGERCATAGEAQVLHLEYCEKYSEPGANRNDD